MGLYSGFSEKEKTKVWVNTGFEFLKWVLFTIFGMYYFAFFNSFEFFIALLIGILSIIFFLIGILIINVTKERLLRLIFFESVRN